LHTDEIVLPPHHTATTARLVAIEDKFKASWKGIGGNLYFSSRLRKIADGTLDGNARERNNLSTLQRPVSWTLMTGALNRPTIFKGKRAIDKRERIEVIFHGSLRTRRREERESAEILN